jgi:hypothetical protein
MWWMNILKFQFCMVTTSEPNKNMNLYDTGWSVSCLTVKWRPHAQVHMCHILHVGTGNGQWMELDKYRSGSIL